MTKLLRVRDILLLTLAGIGDFAEEMRDPLQIMGKCYENMYGFIPSRYKRHNFMQLVNRNLKTRNIEKIIKNGKSYLRLTSVGKSNIVRDFPILSLTRRWNKQWVIVVFDIEEKTKLIRNRFRDKLKGLGFGMLQKSIWISPLDIGQDMREVIESIGLSKNAYVMQVSGFIFGDPKELVRNIWHLDKLEDEYIKIKEKLESLSQLIKERDDRISKSEAKVRNKDGVSSNNSGNYIYELERKKREAMRDYLEFISQFPPLPIELLPISLRDLYFKIH